MVSMTHSQKYQGDNAYQQERVQGRQNDPPPPRSDIQRQNQQQFLPRGQSRSDAAAPPSRSIISLAASPQCEDDVSRYCNKGSSSPISNLKVLQCMDDLDDAVHLIHTDCQDLIYDFKLNMTKDARFDDAAKKQCRNDIKQLNHAQGAVVSCLSVKFASLRPECKKQIFRLAEMQSEDYHLDRALYYACRDDRERFCNQVSAGNGRVYRCLYEHKFDTMMSIDCRNEVQRRQSLLVENVGIDAGLTRACAREIDLNQCKNRSYSNNQQQQSTEVDKKLSLVNLLLCLEDRIKKGGNVQDDCRREMLAHRRMLMSDFELSPDIVRNCDTELTNYCSRLWADKSRGTAKQKGGRVLHCLLDAVRKHRQFDEKCLVSIRTLIRATDPGEDVRADPMLERDCQPIINTVCSNIKPGESNVIMCLLENLRSSRMTEECKDRLMEISYFMARDWRLTPKLLRTCKSNLFTECRLENWSLDKDMSEAKVGYLLGCLYQQRKNLSPECGAELRRLMYIRSKSIDLLPEIEDSCIRDLAKFCHEHDDKGDELKCLQTKYNDLDKTCKEAVKNYTTETTADANLDLVLMKACEPMIQRYCQNGNENNMIRCLIQHKNERSMNSRCKAGIEHHQLTSMKDAFLSQQFRTNCYSEITEHCAKRHTKPKIIQCLADLMLKDALQLKGEQQITEGCRDELKFELLQRNENIYLDPSLQNACQYDIARLCSDIKAGNAQIIDCLKENRDKIQAKACYVKLNKREKLDIIVPENDYSLMDKCSGFISKFCSTQRKQNVLGCLRRNMNQDAMPSGCRKVLFLRLMILNSDARFNKALLESCNEDIQHHCAQEIAQNADNDDDDTSEEQDDQTPTQERDGTDIAENDDEGEDSPNQQRRRRRREIQEQNEDTNNDVVNLMDRKMGGRVIECLRRKYADSTVTLNPQCVVELIDVIQTSKIDVKFDVQLYRSCQKILAKKCSDKSEKEDCLKLLYQHDDIPDDDNCKAQVVRIIKEGEADIHVDRALAFACRADISRYCNDIPLGKGKQLQCLLSYADKSLTKDCTTVLNTRKELWKKSEVNGIHDMMKTMGKSNNSTYLFAICILILFTMFCAGCVCRNIPYTKYSRLNKYK
ncbi:unnamed protein product [Didymodactylos carnosus]|uniref:Golgi apparatus protein 1 n=1 Tax=Didymodactylos carnosus TaxID=1234261 RepID=A0A8S2ICX5_9BILA|nr:unnamed protein product [Didymodactylos carnosus]CAF3736462.1 unnamed protein product [Didymodactylos carnosus]